jgi:hypothetical protein
MLGMLAATPARTGEPTLELLQQQLRQLFPPVAEARVPSPTGRPIAPSPHAITERSFLLANPTEQGAPAPFTSLLRIRNYPVPVRQAHAACVKIVTPYWHGAGVVISADGAVLTSHHLVAGAPALSVQLLDGRLLRVTNVVSFSALHDLALLHIDGGPFAFLPVLPETRPAPGDRLSIVGHPGEHSWKLDTGAVIRHQAEAGTDVIQVDAAIGRGNSGGPMIDEAGRLCAITACAAKLADGSTVKIGVSARAIAEFLAAPAHSASLPGLAVAEKTRRDAEFLQSLCLLTEEWMHDWLAAMGRVSLAAHAGAAPAVSQGPRIAFLNMEAAAEASLKLVLLKTLMARCLNRSTPDPALAAGSAELTGALDRLLDCTTLLSRATGGTPAEVRDAFDGVRQCRALATVQFGRALANLETAGRGAELDKSNPPEFSRLEVLRRQYAPPGSPPGTGHSKGPS